MRFRRLLRLLGTLAALVLAFASESGSTARAGSVVDNLDWAGAAVKHMWLAPSTGKRRFVSQSGSNSNPGTRRRPWRTIQRGLKALRPGWTLYIRDGTYSQNLVMQRAGRASAPITVRNYPGERPVLRPGGGEPDNLPLQVGSGAAYVKFRGLVFAGATGPSTANIYVWGSAHHIQFSRCVSRGSERQGFFSERSTRSIRIIGCYFRNNGGRGTDGSDHNLYVEGTHHVIANNVVAGARNGFGIQLYPAGNRVVITSNTIVGSHNDGIVIGSEDATTTSNAVVVDNILAFNTGFGLSTYWGGPIGSANYAIRNLTWRNGDGGLTGSAIIFSGNLRGNPRFLNRSAGYYRLARRSAAIDRALARFSPRVDYDGRSRPQGRRPDLGAFERAK